MVTSNYYVSSKYQTTPGHYPLTEQLTVQVIYRYCDPKEDVIRLLRRILLAHIMQIMF